MTTVFKSILSITILFFISCSGNDSKNCSNAGDEVQEVTNERGTLNYDEKSKEYRISSAIDGTYDSVIMGVLCNKPTGIKLSEEGTLQVIFSGTYKQIKDDDRRGPVGTTFYYLELSEISKLKN